MTCIVGIDPGQDVAVCTHFLGSRIPLAELIRSPGRGVDEAALRLNLSLSRPTCAYIEYVGVMPGQGATSGATFMVAWGVIRGICRGLDIPYKLVTPQVWKRTVLAGRDMGPTIPKGADAKTRKDLARARKDAQKASAIAFVHERYPTLCLIPPRCRVDNHNLAEAVCLAEYGVRDMPAAGGAP